MSRVQTHGCSKPHIVHPGYQYAMRNPAPIQSTEPPLNYWLIGIPPLLVALFIATVEVLK